MQLTRQEWSIHHNIHLLLHFRQHSLIRDSDPFEHMMRGIVDRLCGPDKVDVGEAAWTSLGIRCLGDLATSMNGPWLR